LRVIWLSLLFSICISGIAFSAQVVTDTTDYFPGSTVTITGSGFASRESVTVQVTHADGTPSGGLGHDPWKVKANNAGGFTTYWVVPFDDNVGETLLVTATGQSSGLIATTTFADKGVVDFRQVANEDTTDLVWINSILQQNNSTYFEHMSVPQRIIFVGTDSTVGNKHVLTLSHQATKGGDSVHAYDFITSWDQSIAAANFMAPGQNLLSRLNSEACDPNIGPGTDSAMCDALRNGPNSCTGWVDDAMGSVLGDNVASRVTAYEVQHGDRIFKVYGSQPVSLCSLDFIGYSSSGSDFYAEYRLVWTSASDSILIEFAGRLALGGDGTGFSYGPGKGASQISGGPYHFKLDKLDGDALGSQDNQIKGADVITPCPTCSISGPDPVECGDTNIYTVTVNGTCTNQSISWSISGNGSIIGPDTGTSVIVVAGNTCNASYILTATITCDNCVNGVSCSDTVLVNDNTPPSITCPANMVLDCNIGATGTGTATATDNCVTNVTITSTDSILSVSCPVIIKRTWTATDGCGNMSSCVQTITIQDTTKPVINAPADKDTFICNADTLKFMVCATDNCSSVKLEKISGPGSLCNITGPSPVCCTLKSFVSVSGTYTFIFKATDTCSNMAFDTVVCKVKVNTPPPPNCPTNDTFTFLCTADTVCVGPFTCADPDTNLASEQAYVNGTPTPIVNGTVCFLPSNQDNVYTVTLICTDSCGKADTCMTLVTVKFVNQPPVAMCPDPETVLLCQQQQTVCIDSFFCSDPNGNLDTSYAIGGTLVGDSICFTPVAGKDSTYQIKLICIDSCGAADTCTTWVTVRSNDPPVCIPPSNVYVTVCTLGAPLCLPAVGAYDLDGDSLCIQKISGPGTCPPVCGDSSAAISCCFTPLSSGTYQFIFEAKEKNICGKADTCMFSVTIKIDSFPPVVYAPDSSVKLCQPDTVRDTVYASDGDFGDSLTLEKCSVYGIFPTKKGVSFVEQEFKFYADTCGIYKFCFKVTDRCGKVDYDTATYVVRVQTNPPTVDAGPNFSKFSCAPQLIKVPVCAFDPDCGDTIKLEKVTPAGTFTTKIGPSPACDTLKFTPPDTGTFCFIFKATDLCNRIDYDTVCITVGLNRAPVFVNCPPDDTVKLCSLMTICRTISAYDPDGDSLCLSKICGPGTFAPVCGDSLASGIFCFKPASEGTYQFCFEAKDSCGKADTCTFSLTFVTDTSLCQVCIDANIGEDTASPGAKVKIPITIKANTASIGGFSLCLEYDPALLTFVNLERGEFFDQPGPFDGSYKWNYLVWRNNPSTVIHKFKLCIIGIGKMYYYGGMCLLPGSQGVLYAEFRLSNNELYRCFRTPIIWERLDPQCIVNAFSNCSGDSVLVFNDTLFYNPRICDSTALWPKQDVEICVGWEDGGVVFKCDVDPIVIGDVNANGFAYEIGDAVLFANYFISGISVFSSDPEIRERQVASSDVNRDGLTLSVADLVFLLRILAGDAQPLGGPPKLIPMVEAANLTVSGSLIESHSPVDLGAILLTFKGEATKLEPLITGLQVKWGIKDGETRLLIYGMKAGEKIPAGTSKLANIEGELELTKVEAADYYGNPVDVNVQFTAIKPESYLLSQNYPNPFNANTTIRFATPIDGKVSLKIYNVAGQLVREFSEFKNAGYHSLTWDGNNSNGQKVSSGVYLYKLQVGEFTEIRKMTLLK